MPGFIDLTAMRRDDIIVLSVLTFLGLMLSLMLLSTLGFKLKKSFNHQLKNINYVAGGIMITAGGYLLLT